MTKQALLARIGLHEEIAKFEADAVNGLFLKSESLALIYMNDAIKSFSKRLEKIKGAFVPGMDVEYRAFIAKLLDGIHEDHIAAVTKEILIPTFQIPIEDIIGDTGFTYVYKFFQLSMGVEDAPLRLGVYAYNHEAHAIRLFTDINEDMSDALTVALEEITLYAKNGLLLEVDALSDAGVYFSKEYSTFASSEDIREVCAALFKKHVGHVGPGLEYGDLSMEPRLIRGKLSVKIVAEDRGRLQELDYLIMSKIGEYIPNLLIDGMIGDSHENAGYRGNTHEHPSVLLPKEYIRERSTHLLEENEFKISSFYTFFNVLKYGEKSDTFLSSLCKEGEEITILLDKVTLYRNFCKIVISKDDIYVSLLDEVKRIL